MRKVIGHFRTIMRHKYYVFKNCVKAGIPIRGLLHDLSKFSPKEFCEGVKYYQGTRSPIEKCKEENGISMAWMHHKGRNLHHYEYWVDYLDQGGIPQQMPFKYALEMVCDYVGAGMAYKKKDFTYKEEYDVWWKNKISKNIAMNFQTLQFVDMMLHQMKEENSNDVLRKKRAILYYTAAENIINNDTNY